MRSNASEWRGFALLGLFFIAAVNPGCGKDAATDDEADLGRVFEQKELDLLVEDGLNATLPVVSPEKLELYRLKQEHVQVAETMRAEVQLAMAPVVMVASLFAVEGMADVVLAIAPAHKLAHVGKIFRRGRKLRNQKNQAKRLEEIAEEVSDITGHSLDELVSYGRALSKQQLKALLKIRQGTKSAKATQNSWRNRSTEKPT